MREECLHGRHFCFSDVENVFQCLIVGMFYHQVKVAKNVKKAMKLALYQERGLKRIIFRCYNKECRFRKSVLNSNLRINDLFYLYF
ncbi:hypothetical protein ENBRE01_3129 [Enteropsectra breve]|nr:hypothetical protein ENBRE01_3129 [Enteropsectra breve]